MTEPEAQNIPDPDGSLSGSRDAQGRTGSDIPQPSGGGNDAVPGVASPENPSPENPSPENAEKPTEEWVTGDEPMTGPQHSYLQTLAREAGEEVPEKLNKAQASDMIDRLQNESGRGK